MTPDIAIIGAGPAGLALAGILEKAGFSYVVYEHSARDVPPRGGCLDLHPGAGQLAMQEAGCFEEFKKQGRAGEASSYNIWDHQGRQRLQYEEGDNKPELDRDQIKKILLTAIPEDKVRWNSTVTSCERTEEGVVVVNFQDGTTASGFKLVVGADGRKSRVRHLVTPVSPLYAGSTFWTSEIHASNPFYPTLEEMAKYGPMIVLGRATMMWIQRQGGGHYRVDAGFKRSEDFTLHSQVDFGDPEAVKKILLADDFYGNHGSSMRSILRAIDEPFHPWPLYYMPPDSLSWSASADVTLIGDAAHVTPPYVGEGVNVAMLDSVELVRALKKHGISREAVATYEQDMFSRGRSVIERSLASGTLYYDWDAPDTLMKANREGKSSGGLGSDHGQSTQAEVAL